MIDVAELEPLMKDFFPGTLGLRVIEATPERVRASLLVERRLFTVPGVLHWVAVMSFADTLGAVATMLNLPEGSSTTTIESKTNFFGPGREGTEIQAETTPLHRGRRTMVWQTRITSPEGKLLALVIQTQAVLAT